MRVPDDRMPSSHNIVYYSYTCAIALTVFNKCKHSTQNVLVAPSTKCYVSMVSLGN